MNSWAEFGFSRVAAVVPKLALGKPLENAPLILNQFQKLSAAGANVLFTPELAITGYTCEDLFHSQTLLDESMRAIAMIVDGSKNHLGLWVVGAPLQMPDGRLFNGAWVISAGKVLGVIPKIFLPNMGEFYERRWFISGRRVNEAIRHDTFGEFMVSPTQIFASGPVRVGIEICQDLWSPQSPSEKLALKGANVILNLSASNEVAHKAQYRRELVRVQSERLHCAYFYASSGADESTKDTVFSGHTLVYELGDLLAEVKPFEQNDFSVVVDFDFERIINARMKDVCFLESVEEFTQSPIYTQYQTQVFPSNRIALDALMREVTSDPFGHSVPLADLFEIQVQGLMKRAVSSRAGSLVVGVSGGLDSTLALWVAKEVRDRFQQGKYQGHIKTPNPDLKLIGVTLPGPGTSAQTLALAGDLLKAAKADDIREISIQAAVDQHLKDLGKDSSDRSVVYENAQARERTQILFDIANEKQGILVGTGDLSELALGWCTFNADQMAHYGVNAGIPKTVIKKLVAWLADRARSESASEAELFEKILALPISPELLPPSADGSIAQETESLIGSYDLHDFFLYHYLHAGFSKEKIFALAEVAFTGQPTMLKQLQKAIDIFFSRFFTQQFKRTTLPPGPKVFKVSLSPRSDLRMPDEIS
jgi:NAD+ synthase (glutamine-hydrolysing)